MAGKNTLEGNWSNSPSSKFNASGKDENFHTYQYNPGINKAIFTGGTKVQPGNGYVYHVFWNDTPVTTGNWSGPESGSLSPLTIVGGPADGTVVTYLIVGGGGGGGGQYPVPTTAPGPNYRRSSGGGGAGGFRTGTFTLMPGEYRVKVGRGGRAGILTSNYTGGTGPMYYGGNGGPSQIVAMVNGSEAPQTFYFSSSGGGGGGYSSWIPGGLAYDGGSGGGSGVSPLPDIGGTGNVPPVSPPQGSNGGTAPSSYTAGGAGGGGIGGSGGSTGAPGFGATAPAWSSDLIGPAVPAPLQPHFNAAVTSAGYYAAGGSGGNSPTTNYAGQGGNSSRTPDYNNNVKWAVPGTGSGGGGANGGTPGTTSPSASNAGPGAPGIVVLRYPA